MTIRFTEWDDLTPLLAEARSVCDDVVLANDLDRVPVPGRGVRDPRLL